MAAPSNVSGTGVRTVRSGRPAKGPGAAFALVSIVLLALVAAGLRPSQPPPPPTAEYAPEAVQALKQAPPEQTSQSGSANGGNGAGAGQGGAGATTTTLPPGTAQKPLGQSGPVIDTKAVKACIGDPPRQVEDAQSPPCVPYWDGDNGGATAKGVTADEIRIGYTGFDQANMGPIFQQWMNRRFQFYGRQVKLIPVSGCDAHPSVAVANAQKVADQNVFAVLGCGDAKGNEYAYYDQLAKEGIVSVHSRASFTSERHLAAFHPYEWSYLPAFDVAQRHLAQLACSLKDGNARWAGAPYLTQHRKFGVVYNTYRDAPSPDIKPFLTELAACGVTVDDNDQIGVVVEPDTADNQSQDTASQTSLGAQRLRQDNVTSVVMLTWSGTTAQMMTAQSGLGYQPENILSNYLYNESDTGMDAQPRDQSSHVFGLTTWSKPLRVQDEFWYRVVQEIDPTYNYPYKPLEYNGWHFAYRGVLMMAAGLQMAGPHLTPETFAQGLQKTTFPNPDTPFFEGKVTVRPGSHSYLDDAAVMWWNQAQRSTEWATQGEYCFIDDGARYRLGSYRSTIDAKLFQGACGRDS